ncbi:ABC transporter ATP-binding protein [Acidaminobacter sp. JC074]|uniref:dipeptide ABC transporter ATP-binding protein n=1 Tax=Acidaminobacter sp. JC074 TaxID=2530199 RepID=UPI001F10CE04|nr:ABC transporter ATP-binding protein [Acidaminobacter sp. JC074]MCH4890871.1 ABC transporter ATP-binding protein [Acidaminobacter sp. JC074]
MNKILEVKNLHVAFQLRGKTLKVVRGVDFDLNKNEVHAIVGESGSGKSVFTKAIAGMLDANGRVTEGKASLDGQSLIDLNKKAWQEIRGKKLAFVFQDPMTSLNPLKKIGHQLVEVLKIHHKMNRTDAKTAALKLLKDVGIHEAEVRYNQYPFEFSGGMRQRVVIANAIACKPDVLICDEPTTALDVTIQAQILDLLKSLKKQYGMSMIFITHDLGVVANIADRVSVMYAGEFVETGTAEDIFYNAQSPYTLALLKSLPQLGRKGDELFSLKGTPPSLTKDIVGDPFAPRNDMALEIDFVESPPFYDISETHRVKTWAVDERAPKREDFKFLELIEDYKALDENIDLYHKNREKVLTFDKLNVEFRKGRRVIKAVNNVSFDIYEGETFALVGESGSGKTTIGRTVIGENRIKSGDIIFKDESLKKGLKKELKKEIQMIFQDPMASLNERAKIEYIISEGLRAHYTKDELKGKRDLLNSILDEVKLPRNVISRFPHEFSGGQRQRIGIARALVMEPKFVIADEPISALDVSIRAGVINLLNRLKEEYKTTYMFIAHDLSIVKFIADRVGILYKGRLVELGYAHHIFNNPQHDYTKSLLNAIPHPDPNVEKHKKVVKYEATFTGNESLVEVSEGHFVLR